MIEISRTVLMPLESSIILQTARQHGQMEQRVNLLSMLEKRYNQQVVLSLICQDSKGFHKSGISLSSSLFRERQQERLKKNESQFRLLILFQRSMTRLYYKYLLNSLKTHPHTSSINGISQEETNSSLNMINVTDYRSLLDEGKESKMLVTFINVEKMFASIKNKREDMQTYAKIARKFLQSPITIVNKACQIDFNQLPREFIMAQCFFKNTLKYGKNLGLTQNLIQKDSLNAIETKILCIFKQLENNALVLQNQNENQIMIYNQLSMKKFIEGIIRNKFLQQVTQLQRLAHCTDIQKAT